MGHLVVEHERELRAIDGGNDHHQNRPVGQEVRVKVIKVDNGTISSARVAVTR